MTDLSDIGHLWGQDIRLSPTGGLASVTGSDRSKERVLRRLLTNLGDYLNHQNYGAGVGALVGQIADLKAIESLVVGQMKLEATVSKTVAPVVKISQAAKGVSVSVSYLSAPEQAPVALSFTVNPNA